MNEQIEKLKEYIKKAKNIVFLGGAGVSTESGIPDFRGEQGLYKVKSEYGVRYETILSHTYFEMKPDTFFDFYKKNMIYPDAMPNDAHKALAKLEQEGKNIWIITQNIDGLHQKAGSKKVIELHGSVYRNHCEKCHKFYSLEDIMAMKGTPRCSCGGIIKPDVVLYEEPLDEEVLQLSVSVLENADLLIIGGTSLNVYPAASLSMY